MATIVIIERSKIFLTTDLPGVSELLFSSMKNILQMSDKVQSSRSISFTTKWEANVSCLIIQTA